VSTTSPAPDDVKVIAAHAAFRRNLRVLMARLDLNAPALAERLGVSRLWVARRAAGDVVPDLTDLARLADALGSTVADLVSHEEPTSTFIPGGVS
jgi:transcriptional regulator with XRE-family HTH domain